MTITTETETETTTTTSRKKQIREDRRGKETRKRK